MRKETIVAFGLLSLILVGVFIFAPPALGRRGYYTRKINLMIGQRFYSPDERDRYITYSGTDDLSTFIISEVIVSKSGFGQGMTIIEYRARVGDKIYVFGGFGRMYKVISGSSDNIVLEMVGHYYP